jgi:hypothetical protein
MFYDVSVSRIQTATKIIRVEADDPDAARGKALEAAGDEDFGCCVTEYDFDADEAVEVADPSVPPHTMNVQPDADEVCAFCGKPMPDDMAKVAEDGWYPVFWDGETQCDGPVCGECLEKYLKEDGGEFVLNELKGEYVSVWTSGQVYRSPCTINIRTRTVKVVETHDADDSGELDREYVVLDGKEYEAAHSVERGNYAAAEQAKMFFWE